MQEEKVLFDATLGFLIKGDKIMLAEKTQKIGAGCLMGYGGGIDGEETPEECMIRELQEESSLSISENSLEKMAIIDFHNTKSDGEKFVCRVHVFFIHDWSGDPQSTEEMKNPAWFDTKSLSFERLMPADRFWMPEVLAGKKIKARFYQGPYQKELIGKHFIQIVDRFD